MNQQDEKSLKNYYANCVLKNKFGLSKDLAQILSNFMLDFYDKFFENFDAEKVEHHQNAASNMFLNPRPDYASKIQFYIGLMDKDTKKYRYRKEIAKQKIFDVLGDCTLEDTMGCYTNEKGERIIMDTIVATKILEQVPDDFQHNVSYKLKEIFNQTSILNVESRCAIRYNNESEDDIKHIQFMMDEFDLSWETAQQAMYAGW